LEAKKKRTFYDRVLREELKNYVSKERGTSVVIIQGWLAG
jgi:hypothetical protein